MDRNVYIVVKRFPNLALVNDELDIYNCDVGEIAGVFAKEEDARKLQEELINQNAADVMHLDCDSIDVTLETWAVS